MPRGQRCAKLLVGYVEALSVCKVDGQGTSVCVVEAPLHRPDVALDGYHPCFGGEVLRGRRKQKHPPWKPFRSRSRAPFNPTDLPLFLVQLLVQGARRHRVARSERLGGLSCKFLLEPDPGSAERQFGSRALAVKPLRVGLNNRGLAFRRECFGGQRDARREQYVAERTPGSTSRQDDSRSHKAQSATCDTNTTSASKTWKADMPDNCYYRHAHLKDGRRR